MIDYPTYRFTGALFFDNIYSLILGRSVNKQKRAM